MREGFCVLYMGDAGSDGTSEKYEILQSPGSSSGPVIYYDIQKLFSWFHESSIKLRRSLEYAIDCLDIEKEKDFLKHWRMRNIRPEFLQRWTWRRYFLIIL